MNAVLAWMLDQLRGNCLEVAKVPGRGGGYVRAVVSHNAPWYREFCAAWERGRGVRGGRFGRTRPRTIIRRRATERALVRMLAGDFSGEYAERLWDAAGGILGEGRRRADS